MPKHAKIEKAYALSNAKIQFVSLVDKAANKRQFLITKAEGSSATFQSFGKIVKADSEAHHVTGIVYEPMCEDTDGEYMTADEIEKAAHWYLKNAGDVDIQHCFIKADGIDVVESSVAKCDMEIEGTPIKKGTWLMTMEVNNQGVWDSITKGDITGFSMGGVAERSDVDVDLDGVEKSEKKNEDIPDSFFAKLTKAIKNAFNKSEKEEQVQKGEMAQNYLESVRSDNLYTAWYCLRNTLEGYFYDEKDQQWKWGFTADETKIREALEDFNAIVTNILTADSVIGEIEKAAKEAPVQKSGRSLSSKNLNALKTICGNLQDFLAEFDDSSDDAGSTEGGDTGDGAGVAKSDTKTKEEEDMKKSEVEALVTEVVKSALEPIAASIAELNGTKPATPETQEVAKGESNETAEDSVSEDTVKSIVKDALSEALAPVTQQLEAIKKSRALPSNLNGEPAPVHKGEEEHYLHGIL